MQTITNRHWRNFSYRNEVPESVLTSEFDYLSEDEGFDGFFQYRKNWYHLSSFVRSEAASGWDGFAADSHFSGVAIKVSDNGEQYQVGLLLS